MAFHIYLEMLLKTPYKSVHTKKKIPFVSLSKCLHLEVRRQCNILVVRCLISDMVC